MLGSGTSIQKLKRGARKPVVQTTNQRECDSLKLVRTGGELARWLCAAAKPSLELWSFP